MSTKPSQTHRFGPTQPKSACWRHRMRRPELQRASENRYRPLRAGIIRGMSVKIQFWTANDDVKQPFARRRHEKERPLPVDFQFSSGAGNLEDRIR
jgi:hypothetical protein